MNVKPGMLAIITRSLVPENVGKIVRVKRFAWNCPVDGPCWWTETDRPCLLATGNLSREGVDPDAWLLPISPGDISEEEVSNLYAPNLKETA